MTTSNHTALYRFEFPTKPVDGSPLSPLILLDLSDLWESRQNATITVDPATARMTGNGTFLPSFGSGYYVLHFCADFLGAPVRDTGIFVNDRGGSEPKSIFITRGINLFNLVGGGWASFKAPSTTLSLLGLVSVLLARPKLVTTLNRRFRILSLTRLGKMQRMLGGKSSVLYQLNLVEPALNFKPYSIVVYTETSCRLKTTLARIPFGRAPSFTLIHITGKCITPSVSNHSLKFSSIRLPIAHCLKSTIFKLPFPRVLCLLCFGFYLLRFSHHLV